MNVVNAVLKYLYDTHKPNIPVNTYMVTTVSFRLSKRVAGTVPHQLQLMSVYIEITHFMALPLVTINLIHY